MVHSLGNCSMIIAMLLLYWFLQKCLRFKVLVAIIITIVIAIAIAIVIAVLNFDVAIIIAVLIVNKTITEPNSIH